MDAFEIGRAFAFPEGLAEGLEAVGLGFELLDAAALAAGDDLELAAGAFDSGTFAPSDLVDEAEAEMAAEEVVSEVVAAVAAARPEVGGAGGERGRRRAADGGRPGGSVDTGAGLGGEAAAGGVPAVVERADASGVGVAPLASMATDADEAAEVVVVSVAPGGGARGGAGRSGARLAGAGRGAAGRGAAAESGRSAAAAFSRGVEDRGLEAAGSPAQGLKVTARVDQAVAARSESRDSGGAAGRGVRELGPGGSDEAGGRAGWTGFGQDSAAPDVAERARFSARGAPGGGLLDDRAVAPQQDGGGERGGGDRPVILDGRLVGQWLSERMARDASRPGAGTTFFDPRQAPAWTPSGVM